MRNRMIHRLFSAILVLTLLVPMLGALPNTTLATSVPAAETRPASSIPQTAVFINGRIINDGGSTILERRFGWGRTNNCSDGWTANVGVPEDYFSYYLTGLNAETTYYFRAWAKNSTGWGHGQVLSLTTNPSTLPDLIVYDITTVNPNPPTAGNWFTIGITIRNQGAGNAAGTFWVEYYFDNTFIGRQALNGLSAGAHKELSSTIQTWPSDANYHTLKGIVDAYDDISESNERNNQLSKQLKATGAGISAPPNTPTSPLPANNDAGVSISTDLTWKAGDPDAEDIVTYDIYFGTDTTPPLLETTGPYAAMQSSVSYELGTLVAGTTYYWKVVVRDNHGTEVESSVWKFTTAEEIVEYELTISSTAGGSVTTPGEGTFTYDTGMLVNLVAEAEESYKFVEWTGEVDEVEAAHTTITMQDNYFITAHFEKIPPSVNGALIGVIISAMVATALVIFLVRRKRAA